MDTYKKFLAFLFSLMVTAVTFFLYMFYQKVDKIGDNVTTITINSAVTDEKYKSLESRQEKIEQRTTLLETKVYH